MIHNFAGGSSYTGPLRSSQNLNKQKPISFIGSIKATLNDHTIKGNNSILSQGSPKQFVPLHAAATRINNNNNNTNSNSSFFISPRPLINSFNFNPNKPGINNSYVINQ